MRWEWHGICDQLMRRKTVHRRVLMLAILSVFCAPAHAFVLTGNVAPSPAHVTFDRCPIHSGYECAVTALDMEYLPTGRNAIFESAWNTTLPGEWNPAGWTLNWAATPVDATMNATTYRAFGHTSGAPDSGAEIRIQWTPSPEQSDLKWIQALRSNRLRYGSLDYMLDVYTFTASAPPLYPYQYTDQRFYDKPTRNCEAGEHILWEAYLYLARVDQANKVATIYDGVHWGFHIDSTAVPEPSGIVVVLVGPALLAWRRVGAKR
jgi:hypothetical protein